MASVVPDNGYLLSCWHVVPPAIFPIFLLLHRDGHLVVEGLFFSSLVALHLYISQSLIEVDILVLLVDDFAHNFADFVQLFLLSWLQVAIPA